MVSRSVSDVDTGKARSVIGPHAPVCSSLSTVAGLRRMFELEFDKAGDLLLVLYDEDPSHSW